MKSTMTDTTVELTCTCEELATWESQGLAVYATPAQDDHAWAVQVYVGNRPNFLYDFCLATVADFCDAEGWDSLGWQEMTAEEWEGCREDTISLTIPRTKQERRVAQGEAHWRELSKLKENLGAV